MWPWTGGWCTGKVVAMEWTPRSRDSSALGRAVGVQSDPCVLVNAHVVLHWNPIVNTLKKVQVLHWRRNYRPNSWIICSHFLFHTCIFVNLHFPNSASELEVTTYTLIHVTLWGGTPLPPKFFNGNVHGCISQVLEVSVGACHAINCS